MSKSNTMYNSRDGIVEIIIRDETGAKLEHFKMNWKDHNRHKEVAFRLKQKYGIELFSATPQKDPFFEF